MKVLVAEDDPVSRGLLELLLPKWGYGIVAVDSGSAAWSVLQSPDSPRLVLLDWMMPGMDGLEICQRVRSRPAQPYFYIILLTAHDKVANVVEGLESGADDYVTKPFHAEELKARLRVGFRMLELEQELVAAREALSFKASHDALTGIWNRGGIIEILERELQRAQREGSSLGIVLADFDHFKAINDTLGHLAGDEVLRYVVRRLSGAIRTYDSLGRYGGEEFLILLPGCDSTTLELSAERLKAAVSAVPIVTSAGAAIATISMGALPVLTGSVVVRMNCYVLPMQRYIGLRWRDGIVWRWSGHPTGQLCFPPVPPRLPISVKCAISLLPLASHSLFSTIRNVMSSD